jgi:hypothetical protein
VIESLTAKAGLNSAAAVEFSRNGGGGFLVSY